MRRDLFPPKQQAIETWVERRREKRQSRSYFAMIDRMHAQMLDSLRGSDA